MVKPIVNLECLNIIDAIYPYIIEMKFFFFNFYKFIDFWEKSNGDVLFGWTVGLPALPPGLLNQKWLFTALILDLENI